MEKMSQFLENSAVLVFMLVLQASQSSYSNPTGFSMKMIMRDSPGSPLYPGNLTQLQRIERLVEFSEARARYLEASTSSNISVVEPQNDAIMDLYRIMSVYFVSFFMGNPETEMYLVMDTGSSTMWTQCLPCSQCYPQSVPIYNSSASSTFANLPCSDPLCSGPGAPFKCVRDECKFDARYLSGQSTEGDVATETVQCLRSNGRTETVNGIVFGCARRTANFQVFVNTAVGGVMGVSWAPESIVTQLGNIANRRFSYCLFPFDSGEDEQSILSFGGAVPNPPGNAFTTPLLRNPDPENYHFYVDLRDIAVGSKRLGFPPGTFAISDDSGGFVVDSGTALTRLADIPYEEVMAAFQTHYDSKRLVRAVVSTMDLCYRYTDEFDEFASMTFHFAGADLFIDGRSVNLYGDNNGKFFCVALLRGDSSSILGAVHQHNTRFTFDGNRNTLQFYSDDCTQINF